MENKTILPIIKWSGTKRYVAEEIISYLPDEIETYYEPFIGSGAILAKFLESKKKFKNIIVSDINSDLISLWLLIKNNPNYLFEYYSDFSNNIQTIKTVKDKNNFYIQKRNEFNTNKTPELFFCLMRTSYNGLVRYNNKGNFNAPYHLNRDGILPKKLKKILDYWNNIIQIVEFKFNDYKNITPLFNDFIVLDPPYFNVTGQIYNGKINEIDFINYISNLECKYLITLDGKNENDDRTYYLPNNLYKRHLYLKMGKSSFRKLLLDNNMVEESLYLNY